MSDAVLVALIAGTPGVVASVLGFLNQVMIRRAATLAAQAATVGERAAKLGEKNEQHLAETKQAMVTLEKNTNSIKDELVAVTKIAARAEGNLEGRAQQKAELHKAENGDLEEHSG